MSKMTKNKLALLALAGLGAVASGSANAAGSMTVESKGGFEIFDLEDKNYWMSVGGRLLLDQAWFDADDEERSDFPSGSDIRSARLRLKGGVGSNWVYKMDIDLIDGISNPGVAQLGEAFIGYNGCKNFWFALGQISIPYGLETWAATEDITFMELALPSEAFSPSLGLGLYAEWHGEMFTLAGAIYHPPAGSFQYGDVISAPPVILVGGVLTPVAGTGPNNSSPGSEPLGVAARVTFSPVHDEYTVYHAGVSYRYEDLQDNSNNLQYSTGLEVRARQTPVLFTNIPPNSVQDHQVWGAELAGRWGPLIVQGEYMWADVDRDDLYPSFDLRNPGGSFDFHGWYLSASYVITGEVREYDFDSGTFGSVHPISRRGAWEIAIRHSFVDFDNVNLIQNSGPQRFVDFVPSGAVDIFGSPAPTAGNNVFNAFSPGALRETFVGSAHSTTIGLNWYVNDNVRFAANYVRTDLPDETDVDAFALRGYVTWK